MDAVNNEDDRLYSLTIEIELDNDEQYGLTQLSHMVCDPSPSSSFETFYDPPPTASEARPHVSNEVCVRHLPRLAFHQFELYMNPPSYGSMHNWEYLASNLGLSSYEIMARIPYLFFSFQELWYLMNYTLSKCLRTSDSPTRAMLQRFLNCPLNRILDAICELNRIDVLLVLQPYVNGMKASADALSDAASDSGAFFDEPGPSAPMAPSSHRVAKNSHVQAATGIRLSNRFILVTHHEEETSAGLKKNFKWLMKNLKKHGEQSTISVFDIEECTSESDLLGGLHTMFENAAHIVCVFSEDYKRMLHSSDDSQCVVMKKYLHNLMNTEYVRKLGVNQRFRAVMLQGTERDVLPTGWPQNTLVYEFPSHHKLLSQLLCLNPCRVLEDALRCTHLNVQEQKIFQKAGKQYGNTTQCFTGLKQCTKMRLFLLIIVIIGNCLKPSESVSKAKEGPFVACEAETACTCDNEDGEVNCDNVSAVII
uniref:SEFIR domain-containing protein n=1 Tax=Ascaris lumbricoides TaxID=6252 RepID=A0A0M3HWL9_ASCLU